MVQNPEAEKFFEPLSAHSDVAEQFIASLRKPGEYERRAGSREYAAPYIVTRNTVFCAAAGMSETCWRLRPTDIDVALASGAELNRYEVAEKP